MFLAHLPAGYILTKKLQEKWKLKRYLWVGLLGSVFPDFDIAYFYLTDDRQHLHHSYWTHLPFDWLILTAITWIALRLFNKKELSLVALIFFSNVFLHFILDTVVGKIEWLYPFKDTAYALFEVPAAHNFWVWNFFFHWTFLFEIGIIVWALAMLWRNAKRKRI